MTTLAERIRAVREAQKPKMSQKEFSSTLGTSRTAYAKYEMGLVVPSNTFVQLLCSRYHVNDIWLRTGEGAMFNEDTEGVIYRISQELHLNEIEKEFLQVFFSFPEEQRDNLIKLIRDFVLRYTQQLMPLVQKEGTNQLTAEQEEELVQIKQGMLAKNKALARQQKRDMYQNLLEQALNDEEKGQSPSSSGNSATIDRYKRA